MTISDKPTVCVITPVFNGEQYIAECIESVLQQSYKNFQYIIVDNCSTDSTLEIAAHYEQADDRIRIIESSEHVGPIQNWNRALSKQQTDAEFTKFVHADDWLFPDCLERMLDVASTNKRLGIISAYRLEEDRVSLDKLPRLIDIKSCERNLSIEGAVVTKAIFMEYASVLGSPTALLFRSEAIKEHSPFFDESYLHADKEACIRVLKHWSFGFVRDVLTYTRRHNESVTSRTSVLDTMRQEDLLMLIQHGSDVLNNSEMSYTMRRMLDAYYEFLAKSIGCNKGGDFWRSHKATFKKASLAYRYDHLVLALFKVWLNPLSALRNIIDQRKAALPVAASAEASRYLFNSRSKGAVTND